MSNVDINKIYLGDNADIMRTFPDNFIDLTVTSPPYGSLRTYGNTYAKHFDFYQLSIELFRITKDGGILVWVVTDQTKDANESGESFKQALGFKDVGFNLYDTMIYKKNNHIPLNDRRYESSFEFMFVLAKLDKKSSINTFNGITTKATYGGRLKSRNVLKSGSSSEPSAHSRFLGKRHIVKDDKLIDNVWDYNTGKYHNTKDMIAHDHPAIFPDKLAYDHIYSWTNPGDLVLDPFCGSGTTCAMAKSLNRNYIGIEIVKKYYYIAISRCK